MKSKKKQRLLALILSMVLMLSASISALAEGDVQTEASGTETTENQAAAQSLEEETVPETEVSAEETGIALQSEETSTEPVQESTEQEVTETPAESEQEVVEEPVETADTTQPKSRSLSVFPAWSRQKAPGAPSCGAGNYNAPYAVLSVPAYTACSPHNSSRTERISAQAG